ncbi:alpha-L-arabinofuranosidase [Niastella vici]|uniref:non-reducing end alpha-L-arabinofuranosidase n=1 Tax=Niastella vici TaxID=1703345 RepID=A0A1V9FIU3_9BACT|nr:alpha-L-arabinofuranosidase C-terminal domain-containing protein [Niastella vici]OQP58275.1 alpha-L-arabinofuranosidase [Niastella vici]
MFAVTRIVFLLLIGTSIDKALLANEPDSVYLFAYTTIKDKGRSGLHFAWSADRKKWNLVGNEYGYVKCDYGPWGEEKQMHTPYLFQNANGEWQCIWSLDETINQFAYVASANLVTWNSQRYPYLKKELTFRQPVVQYDKSSRQYTITFISGDKYYKINTIDFKTYDEAVAIPASAYKDDRITVTLPAGAVTGNVSKVAWSVVNKLTETATLKGYEYNQTRESFQNDSIRFAPLRSISATVTPDPEKRKPISDLLIGVFFEDINYAADGGLYAELLQNRDFEYTPADRKNRDSSWNSKHSWTTSGANLHFTIDSTTPLHINNAHYAVLNVQQPGSALINSGYDGIPLKKGDAYDCSLFVKNSDGKSRNLLVKLVNADGSILAQATIKTGSQQWKKYTTSLIAAADAKDARFELQPLSTGSVLLDMISLFPEKTFKNRKNGLRADLAETVAAIHPRFIRFPGGCLAHGDGVDNIYRWKNTIGPIEARKPQPNIWRYHQTVGLGYFEYFQYCEDIGATPLPVLAAGVPCQNSGLGANGFGQQGGIPMNEMDQYVQEILDLVEWANGPVTSKWGKLRAEAGHPAPFNLKYIGVGNEDLITDLFSERFTLIYNALKQQHPEITVIGTVGPFHDGSDYEQGWALASQLKVPMVDEHYYESPGWFINNPDFYDSYDRNKPKVYLGEYASHGNTLFNALAEALYLTNIERNGDVVHMASYAPLLAREKHTQWNPDLIYFNNTEVKPTVNYEVQKLFGNNAGTEYLPSVLTLSKEDEAVRKRLGISIVRDTTDGSIIVKLVNLLPVATSLKLDLTKLAPGSKAERTLLNGKPADRQNPVTVTTVAIGNVLEDTLLPYSFTVWKIHK